jgi:hypothetical protein
VIARSISRRLPQRAGLRFCTAVALKLHRRFMGADRDLWWNQRCGKGKEAATYSTVIYHRVMADSYPGRLPWHLSGTRDLEGRR